MCIRDRYETVGVRREIVHYVYEPDSFTPLARMSVPMDRAEAEQSTAPSLAYYHCDQIGTPQELTDEAGEVAWSARYRAWGAAQEVISEAARKAGITSPLRFAGQYFDRETGLHYNRHRYYDPTSGRFVSKDPIGLTGGINAYQYAPNPISWIDPFGLAKRGPKTGGCGPHNEMIAAWGKEVKAAGGDVIAGGGRQEVLVKTPGGVKSGRRPDIIYTDADGNTVYGNVGKVRADGVTPVTREQQAMDDMKTKTQGGDVPDDVQFRAYNCCLCKGK